MEVARHPRWSGIALLLATGCAAPLESHHAQRLRLHVIAADEEGHALDPAGKERWYDLDAAIDTMLRRAAECAERREVVQPDGDCGFERHEHPDGPRRVRRMLLHIHGGLNEDDDARRRAVETLEEIDLEPGDDWHHPIFLVWPSGGISSVVEHVSRLRFGSHIPEWLGWPASPFVLAYDLVKGLARAPETVASMLVNDSQVGLRVGFGVDFLPTWTRARDIGRAFEHAGQHEEPAVVVPANGPNVHLGSYTRGFWTQAWRMTRYIVLLIPKIVVTPLLIDGIGREAWRVMLHRASNTLRPTDEFEAELFSDTSARKLRRRIDAPATGTFAHFFAKLQEVTGAAESDVCWEITLVGHSMGAIIINDALQLFPHLPVKSIVLMAPACSIAEAEEALVPYLTRQERSRLYVLTLHPIAEADEVVAVDLPSRGSLLEWIDQWFEAPDHPLDRRLGKWNNAIGALHVFAPVLPRVALKGFGVSGCSKPQEHGDFNDCKFWQKSFWEPHH